MKDNSSDRQPRKTTARGFTKSIYLTDDQIDQILDGVAGGEPIEEACRAAGTSSSQFNRRCNRDPGLQERLDQAYAEAPAAKREFLRYHIHRQIRSGNYKALLNEAMIHLPEYEVLRTQRFEHTVKHQDALVEVVLKVMEGKPLAEIEQKIAELEALPPDQHPLLELPARTAA